MHHIIDDLRKIPVLKILVPFVIGIICIQRLSPELCSSWSEDADICATNEGQDVHIFGILKRAPEFKSRTIRLDMEVEALSTCDTIYKLQQKIIVYLKNTQDSIPFLPGQKLAIKGSLSRITNNGNPNEFDYASYMAREGYFFTFFADPDEIHELGSDQSIRHLPMKIRHKISSRWPRENQSAAILRALCLGDKSQLDIETKSDFSDAGAVHLLAVSGLHIGIVWWILDLLLRFPNKRAWRFLKTFIIVLVLWNYAAVTGFSESVNRSVLMFSLVAISKSLKRSANIYNTLFLSAFILLFLHPERISDPGFQLSYLAVFGIVTLQPKMQNLLHSNNKILQWILDLISVSIAAQLSTLPLILYYFHQFPSYFLLSNILSIPLVTILLTLFIIFLPIFLLSVPFCLPDKILLGVSSLLYKSVDWIAALPGSHIQEIPMLVSSVILFLIVIFVFSALLYYKRVFYLIMLSFAIAALCLSSYLLWQRQSTVRHFQTYNFSSLTAFSFQEGMHRILFIFPEEDSLNHYEREYFQNSFLMPLEWKSDKHIYLNTLEGEEFRISKGLWAFKCLGKKVLLIGECDLRDLKVLIDGAVWDEIILRTGFPYGTCDLFKEYGISDYVFDGTVREWEIRSKKN